MSSAEASDCWHVAALRAVNSARWASRLCPHFVRAVRLGTGRLAVGGAVAPRLASLRDAVGGVVIFMVILLVFHVLWRLGRPWFEEAAWFMAMADVATRWVYLASARVNEVLLGGFMTRLDAVNTFRFELVAGADSFVRHLIIDHTCSGLKQFYQAFFLLLLYPGVTRHKIWYIPMALLVMHLVNIFRVVMLSLTMVYAYQHWDFIHDWVLRPFFYVVLFGLWVIWDQKFTVQKT